MDSHHTESVYSPGIGVNETAQPKPCPWIAGEIDMKLTERLRSDYRRLFDTCIVRDNRAAEVESAIGTMISNLARYQRVADVIEMPWFVIAVIHLMESSLQFDRHLHNGDPLTERTTHVPSGRPLTGSPPFTWEESAMDALRLQRMDRWSDWSVPGTLYKLEGYNGWGYRKWHPEVLSPYLWSYSNHYTRGKYVADGTFSNTAVSRQMGAAVVLRRMAEKNLAVFDPEQDVSPTENRVPLLRYAPTEKSAQARALQEFLNTLPSIYVKVDGYAGDKTSDAFKRAAGYYLYGDARSD